jgi:hypothetical protein
MVVLLMVVLLWQYPKLFTRREDNVDGTLMIPLDEISRLSGLLT